MEVQLFVTCLVDSLFPDVGVDTVAALRAAGCEVSFPEDQTCCGQPAFNAGFNSEAKAMAKHTVDVLSQTEGPVIVPSGSCADMIIHHIPELLDDDPAYKDKAAKVSGRTRELSQFLVNDRSSTQRIAPEGPVVYHPSCHGLRNLGIATEPDVLLESAERVDLGEEAEICCGFGGVFAVKRSDISGELLDRKLDAIEASGAEIVCGGDVGCLMNLEGGARRRGMAATFAHIASLLADPSASDDE